MLHLTDSTAMETMAIFAPLARLGLLLEVTTERCIRVFGQLWFANPDCSMSPVGVADCQTAQRLIAKLFD